MFITLKCFYEILHTFGAIPDKKSGHVRTQSEIVRKTTPQEYPHRYTNLKPNNYHSECVRSHMETI